VIDIQLLRKNPQEVAARLATRGAGAFDLQRFLALEAKRKALQTAAEQALAERNKAAKEFGQAKAKGADVKALLELGNRLKAAADAAEAEASKVQGELQDFLERVPNLPHESVPIGGSSEENREERRWGTPRKFDFAPKDHVDVGEGLRGLDFATGVKVAGSRFVVMRGEVAHLHRAIAQFMLDTHTREHGYTEVYAPYMVTAECANGVSSLAKFEGDLFKLRDRDLYLIPTAEYPVTNFVREEILAPEALPMKLVCHSRRGRVDDAVVSIASAATVAKDIRSYGRRRFSAPGRHFRRQSRSRRSSPAAWLTWT